MLLMTGRHNLLLLLASFLRTEWIVSAFVVRVSNYQDCVQLRFPQSQFLSFAGSIFLRETRDSRTCRWAFKDDEEEDDEEEDEKRGPLSKGIDSVSWLPSVIGSKGDNLPITSAKEVSGRDCDNLLTCAGNHPLCGVV